MITARASSWPADERIHPALLGVIGEQRAGRRWTTLRDSAMERCRWTAVKIAEACRAIAGWDECVSGDERRSAEPVVRASAGRFQPGGFDDLLTDRAPPVANLAHLSMLLPTGIKLHRICVLLAYVRCGRHLLRGGAVPVVARYGQDAVDVGDRGSEVADRIPRVLRTCCAMRRKVQHHPGHDGRDDDCVAPAVRPRRFVSFHADASRADGWACPAHLRLRGRQPRRDRATGLRPPRSTTTSRGDAADLRYDVSVSR